MRSTTITFSLLCVILPLLHPGNAFMNMTLGELPAEIRDEFLNIFNNVLDFVHKCDSSDTKEVKFLLYTKNNIHKPILLNPLDPVEVQGNKPTVFIIHGWLADSNTLSIPKLREAYLNKGDYNVIMVDWSKTTFTIYTHAYCALPVIAKQVAKLVCLLDSNYNVPMEMIHLIGHSLGAQMSGLIGQDTLKMCQKPIERITGLDPAGPLFFGLPISQRLDPTDAKFVQVIHTNGGVFGYLTQCGHVDFFVNCGMFQANCIKIDITKILTTTVGDIICSHCISIDYMAESVSSDKFIGQSCKSCPSPCIMDVFFRKSEIMGDNTPSNARSSFLVIVSHNCTHNNYYPFKIF